MSDKRRDYCFTLNNYTGEEEECLRLFALDKKVRYLIFGREVGDSGTPHLQGYVYYHHPCVFRSLKKIVPRAHIEPCRGNTQSNIDYCSKDKDFEEFGERPLSQKRCGELGKEHWVTTLSLAKRGKLDEIDARTYIAFYPSLNAIAQRFAPMPPDNADGTIALWYYGSTGTGKSRLAREQYPVVYLKMCNKWWCGYKEEEAVLIEDFDKLHHMLGHHLKIWADRYSFPAEIKGGKINIRPKVIIVTSNWHPNEIWGTEPQTLEPILRRFKITHFN